MDKGIGEKSDVAFLKFCYLDAGVLSDAEKMFNEYRNAMSALQKKYPDTIFIHFTMPLISPSAVAITGFPKQ